MSIKIMEPQNVGISIMPEELFLKNQTAVLPLQVNALEEYGYKAWYSYDTGELEYRPVFSEDGELEEQRSKIKELLTNKDYFILYEGFYEIGANKVFYDIVVKDKKLLLLEHKEAREGSYTDSSGHWFWEFLRVSQIKV